LLNIAYLVLAIYTVTGGEVGAIRTHGTVYCATDSVRASLSLGRRHFLRIQVRTRMRKIAAVRVHYGYRKICVMLQGEGFELSEKVVYRLYCEEG